MNEGREINRRRVARKRVYWGGEIALNDYFESFGCVLRDVSESGARIHLSTNVKLPEHFRIRVANRSLEANAQVAWRDGMAAGLSFDRLAAPVANRAADKPDVPRAALRRMQATG